MVELDSLYTFGDYFRYGLDLAVFIICVWVYLATRHLSLVLFLLMMICQFGLEMATISYYNRDNSFSTGLSSITTSEIMTSEDLMFERMIDVVGLYSLFFYYETFFTCAVWHGAGVPDCNTGQLYDCES